MCGAARGRGAAVRADAPDRPAAARSRCSERLGRPDRGGRRLQAARHLRLPVRADRRDRRRARRHASTSPDSRALMEEQRDRARAPAPPRRRATARPSCDAGFTTEFVGYEQLDVRTQVGALVEERRRPAAAEAARVAVLRGRRRPGLRPGRYRVRQRAGRVVEQVIRQDGDQLIVAAPRARHDRCPASACARTCWARRGARRWRTTRRRTCCTRAARGAGRPRHPGRLLRGARQAALRLPPRRPADAGAGAAGGGDREPPRRSRTGPCTPS